MHLLLAIGAALVMFAVSVGNSLYTHYLKNHVRTELEDMKVMSTLTMYGDHWMVDNYNNFNLRIPAEIRQKSYEELMVETWGENYLERNPNWKFDPAKTIAIPRRKYWNEYFSRKYGEKFDKKYPYLKFPSEPRYK